MKEPKRSRQLFSEAQRYMPGGVNSPARAFKAVGGDPLFMKWGKGSRICDEDGNEFIDYVCSWGALVLGHSHPQIVAALKGMVERGTSFGTPTELETVLAKMIYTAVPSMEMVRFVNSGTEATMSALRLARAFTGRDKVVKFAGCYHGHSDGLLARAGSGVATLGIPDSPGVPRSFARNTLVASYNDIRSVESVFEQYPKKIAAVIVEPVAANMGVVPPLPGFLEGLRRLTKEFGTVLIFDEVITGFRLAYGGAQSVYRVKPDLTCLGKIIGGGLPVGAYGGRGDIMEMVAPLGPVYQAGTLSGNPLAMTAGIEVLKALSQQDVYRRLEDRASALEAGIAASVAKRGTVARVSRFGSLLTIFFTRERVTDYESARRADTVLFGKFFHRMLAGAIYWPPSQFEAAFISAAHSEDDVQATVEVVDKALSYCRCA